MENFYVMLKCTIITATTKQVEQKNLQYIKFNILEDMWKTFWQYVVIKTEYTNSERTESRQQLLQMKAEGKKHAIKCRGSIKI